MNAKKEDDDMSNSIKCMECGFENLVNDMLYVIEYNHKSNKDCESKPPSFLLFM